MFRMVSIIGFVVLFGSLFLHHLVFPCGYKPRFSIGSIIRKKVHLLTLLFPEQQLNLAGKLRKLIFLVGLICFAVLFLTGFLPVVCGGKMHGWPLMIHATFALVFIACGAIVVFLGAGDYAFNKKDADAIPTGCKCTGDGCWLTDTGVGAKAGFWALAILALPVTLTMVLSMLPLFGTHGQHLMFELHRWSALIFAWIAIVELYILTRMGVLKDTKIRNKTSKNANSNY